MVALKELRRLRILTKRRRNAPELRQNKMKFNALPTMTRNPVNIEMLYQALASGCLLCPYKNSTKSTTAEGPWVTTKQVTTATTRTDTRFSALN